MTPDQIKDWREPTYKIVSNNKFPTDKSSDNGALFTAEYILMCDEPLSEKLCFQTFVNACQIEPGLYSRYPGDTDLNSWDNLIGIVAVSVKLGLNYHKDILAWGQAHNWTWNNSNPNAESFESFLGRYPAFPAFLQMANGITPSPADELLFIASCEASAMTPVGNESGKCLQYLMNKTVLGKRSEVDLSIWLWKQIMLKKYPNGPRDMYLSYFGPLHPFSQFSPTVF